MATRPLIYYPDSVLHKQVGPAEFSAETTALVHDLVDSMFAWGGIGLAAPQVGVSSSVFVISQELDEGGELIKWGGETSEYKGAWVFLNPTIIRLHPERETGLEGCLSFPDVFLKISRHKDCVIEAYNLQGDKFFVTTKGFLARAIQHEHEHLRGATMLDWFGPMKRAMVNKKMKKWRKRHGIG